MSKRLLNFATDLLNCMGPIQDECLCDMKDQDVPPAEHSDYCPVYLYDYIKRTKEGITPQLNRGATKGGCSRERCPYDFGVRCENCMDYTPPDHS